MNWNKISIGSLMLVFTIACVALVNQATVNAQGPPPCGWNGYVTIQGNGNPLVGATVSALCTSTGHNPRHGGEATTNSSGYYFLQINCQALEQCEFYDVEVLKVTPDATCSADTLWEWISCDRNLSMVATCIGF